MKRVPRGRITILALALALGTTAAREEGEKETKEKKEEEEIHVCKDKTGEIVYQSYPCPEEPRKPRSQPVPVKPESQPAAKTKAQAKPEVKPEPATPGPPPGVPQRAPAAWRLVGRPSVDRVPSAAQPPVGPVDPRFASPERTWQTFSTAMRDGDRVAARACLTSTALRDLGPLIDSSTPEKLSEFVGGPARVSLEGDVGPFWSLRISRARERPKWIFLVRTEGGEWKIAEI